MLSFFLEEIKQTRQQCEAVSYARFFCYIFEEVE